jgi:hypothetical protein
MWCVGFGIMNISTTFPCRQMVSLLDCVQSFWMFDLLVKMACQKFVASVEPLLDNLFVNVLVEYN